MRHLEKKDGETGGIGDEEMEELDSFPICHFAFFIVRFNLEVLITVAVSPLLRISVSQFLQSGTLTVFMISRRTASASSLRRNAEAKRELTRIRCAKTGTTRRLISSGMQ